MKSIIKHLMLNLHEIIMSKYKLPLKYLVLFVIKGFVHKKLGLLTNIKHLKINTNLDFAHKTSKGT